MGAIRRWRLEQRRWRRPTLPERSHLISMDAALSLALPSALAPGHYWEVSLALSGDCLDETWTYRADGFEPVSARRSERFSSVGDALRRLSARSAELLQAAARRAEAPSPLDAAEDAARLAGRLGAGVPGMVAWSAAWQAQARAAAVWWDPAAWKAAADAAAALAPGALSDVLSRLRALGRSS